MNASFLESCKYKTKVGTKLSCLSGTCARRCEQDGRVTGKCTTKKKENVCECAVKDFGKTSSNEK